MRNGFDVTVIGGGIHGAGIAQASAAYGLRTLLLEKNTVGSGTSSRSTKLIHGGLRYLESWQFGVVRECLHEREILQKIAPNLVQLKPFYIPLYTQSSRSKWEIQAGLTMYRMLGNFTSSTRFHKVAPQQWRTLDGLKIDQLKQVFQYYDAQTDDLALTRAVIDSAKALGCVVREHATFSAARKNHQGFEVSYEHQRSSTIVQTKVLVNASGPWVNDVLSRINTNKPAVPIELVQGTHIILNGQTPTGLYYVEAPSDRRAVFITPWKHSILVGTTETPFQGDPSSVQPQDEEVDYLLETYNFYFPKQQKRKSDVETAFAGLRVLPVDQTGFNQRSRETVLLQDTQQAPKLISVYGGKLTAYRLQAEKVLALIAQSLPLHGPTNITARITLT